MNPRIEPKPRPSPLPLVMVLIAASILGPPSPPAQGAPHINGKWTSQETPGANRSFVPIHIVLTRGYGSHHSQVLWWEGKFGGEFWGGLLGWNPNQTQCDSFPVGSFTSITVSPPPANIFCAGHSALADGSLLITGGNEAIEIGIDTSVVFHPDTKQWEFQSSMKMAARRWYPTNTTLPSGEVMTFSGSEYNHLLMWGGKSTADPTWTTPSDSLYREILTPPGPWDSTVLPTPAGTPPEPREGHTAVFYKETTPLMIFGGRKGTADADLLNDLRPMYVGQVDGGFTYGWANVTSSNPKPAPRMRHSAVMIADNTMVVFGGVFQQSVVKVKGDVWTLTPGVGQYVWTELFPTGTGPSPRSGHAAIADRDNQRMLVFGGADPWTSSKPQTTGLRATPCWRA
ncbi:MAG: Kelch repeat-containing protein [Candidatus Eiseniibacteriota bacterium]